MSISTAVQDHLDSQYAPNQPYNQSDAYQPHATILEPADFEADNSTLKLTLRPFQLTTTKYGDPEFLKAMSTISITPIAYTSHKYGWKYDSRHQAQSILPFLYLGPASVARDPNYIAQNGITMVIAVRSAQSARFQPKWLDPSRFQACANLQTATFDVDGPFDLIQRVQPMLKLVTDHLQSHTTKDRIQSVDDIGGRILVFCESGNDRSPVLVAAYLMLVYGIAWHESLNLIHAFRFSVSLNGMMNEMLKTWEGIVGAERDTACAISNASSGTVQSSRKAKRTIDDAYDSDETMTDEPDAATRPGVSPFVDTR